MQYLMIPLNLLGYDMILIFNATIWYLTIKETIKCDYLALCLWNSKGFFFPLLFESTNKIQSWDLSAHVFTGTAPPPYSHFRPLTLHLGLLLFLWIRNCWSTLTFVVLFTLANGFCILQSCFVVLVSSCNYCSHTHPDKTRLFFHLALRRFVACLLFETCEHLPANGSLASERRMVCIQREAGLTS